MLVIDFLKNISTNLLVDSLVSTPGYFEMIDWDNRKTDLEKNVLKEKAKDVLKVEIDKIKNTGFEPKEGLLVVVKRCYDEDGYYDTCLLDYKNFDLKAFESEPEKNPLLGLTFSPRREILGLELSDYCLEKYGQKIVAGSILKELTTFSIFEEEREHKIKEFVSDLCFQAEHLDEQELLSEDEVFDSLREKFDLEPNTSEEKEEKDYEALTRLYIEEYTDIIKGSLQLKKSS